MRTPCDFSCFQNHSFLTWGLTTHPQTSYPSGSREQEAKNLSSVYWSTLGLGDVLVLAQDEGGQGGRNNAHAARDGPPGILHEEAQGDEEAAERVVHKHHLGQASEHPVEKLEHRRFV